MEDQPPLTREFDRHRFLGQVTLSAGTPPSQYVLFNRITDRYFFRRERPFLSLRDTLVEYLRELGYACIAIYNLSEGLIFPDDGTSGQMRRLYQEITTGVQRAQEDLDDDLPTAQTSTATTRPTQPVAIETPVPAARHGHSDALTTRPAPTAATETQPRESRDDRVLSDLFGLGQLLRQTNPHGRKLKAAVIVERLQNLIVQPHAPRIRDQLQSWGHVRSGNVSFLIADVGRLEDLPQALVGPHRSGVIIINVGSPTQAEIEEVLTSAWAGSLDADFGDQPGLYNNRLIGVDPIQSRELKSRLESSDILTIRSYLNECARRNIDTLTLNILTQITTNTVDVWSSLLTDEEIARIQIELERRIKGQAQAISRMLKRLRNIGRDLRRLGGTGRAGGLPLTSFFFVGPTGVGKTEVFRVLTEQFSSIRTRQFNMPEYNSRASANRFFGAPPGYVGHGRGELGQFLIDNPATIMLFDEFEKAHTEVRRNFLTILEGNLTTGDGIRVDLSQAILIFTSNAGAAELEQLSATSSLEEEQQQREEAREIVRRALIEAETPPELVGRLLGSIVTFSSLDEADIREVITERLGQMEEYYHTRFDPSTLRFLMDRYDHRYGARAIVDYIERDLRDDLLDMDTEEQVVYKTRKGETKAARRSPNSEETYQRRPRVQDRWSALLAEGVLKRLDETLHERVRGQPFAVKRVVRSFRRIGFTLSQQGGGPRAGDPPLAVFFFVGPTGVGKTEIFRALSGFFGPNINSHQFNMPEFAVPGSATRLTGGSPQYVGYGPGELGPRLLANPSSIILFDEFEKAHPEVFEIFLTMLEGKLTTGDHGKVDLSQTILVFTSNAGSVELMQLPPANSAEDERLNLDHAREIVRRNLFYDGARPELIARLLSAIIPFAPLSEAVIEEIIALRLDELAQRLKLRLDSSVNRFLLDRYKPADGARPVVDSIRLELQEELYELLEGYSGSKESLTVIKNTEGDTQLVGANELIRQTYQGRPRL